MGDFESIDASVDIGVEDVDSKIIPEQILLSDYKRVDHLFQEVNTNICQHNNSFIWCLPTHYNQEKHPFTCRRKQVASELSVPNIFPLRFFSNLAPFKYSNHVPEFYTNSGIGVGGT